MVLDPNTNIQNHKHELYVEAPPKQEVKFLKNYSISNFLRT